jgi:hypothetical protein
MKRSALKPNPAAVAAWIEKGRQKARDRPPKPRKAVKRVSGKRAGQNRDYSTLRVAFLAEHPFCAPCHDGGTATPATEIHHVAGREGKRLCNTLNFLAVCRSCHDWIEANPKEAAAKGYKTTRLINEK